MFLKLFGSLRNHGVPVTLREYLDLLAGVEKGLFDNRKIVLRNIYGLEIYEYLICCEYFSYRLFYRLLDLDITHNSYIAPLNLKDALL